MIDHFCSQQLYRFFMVIEVTTLQLLKQLEQAQPWCAHDAHWADGPDLFSIHTSIFSIMEWPAGQLVRYPDDIFETISNEIYRSGRILQFVSDQCAVAAASKALALEVK